MSTQDKDLLAKYGEGMFYTHLIEDLLKLILKDAAYFNINGYQSTCKSFERLRMSDLIEEFGRAFPDSGNLVKTLDLLNKIRNKVTHALIPEVGSDFGSAEGRDQIHAMLCRFVNHATKHRVALGLTYEALVKQVTKTDVKRIFEREDEQFEARVADSKIEDLLNQLEKLSQN